MDVTPAFEWGLTLCAALAVGFLKRGFGSGVGMALTPLLALVHSPRFALGLLALYMTWADLGMIRDLWKGWNRRYALILFPGIMAEMLLGTWILANLSETQLRQFIGGICLVFALYQTAIEIKGRPPAVPRLPMWLGVSVGGVSGISSALSNSGGTIVLLFLLGQNFSKGAIIATIWALFIFLNPLKLAAYWSIGIIQGPLVLTSLLGIPFIWAGIRLGAMAHERISPRLFNFTLIAIAAAGSVQLLLIS